MKTAAQLKTLEKARAVRLNQQAGVSIPVSTTNATPSAFEVNPEMYCLAALSEGLGETQARRFLAKCQIIPPSKHSFYESQNSLYEKLEKINEKSLKDIRDNLPDDTIFGLDCSWSAKRNASHAIVIFMDMRSHLIFDKVIISRNKDISDIEFYGPSNLMELEAVKLKRDTYSKCYKFIGFVHDFDVDTAPTFQPDDETGQLIELLDPGHLKSTLENIFKAHNTDNFLYQLKTPILTRFSYLTHNKTLTVEQKVDQWYQTPQWILNDKTLKKKGYLVNDTKSKRRVTCEIAMNALLVFLSDSEWLLRKCSVYDTQAIESWNAVKAKMCPKHLSFQKSFRLRCILAIEKWNIGSDWFLILQEQLLHKQQEQKSIPQLECERILKNDEAKRLKARKHSHELQAMKMRNIKRKLKKMKNKIDPNGHQYASDQVKAQTSTEAAEKLKRIDPTRKIALINLPNITNTFATNCFINSLLQLLRKTNPEENCQLARNHAFVQLMKRLNAGESLTVSEISSTRKLWSPPFSPDGQEDVVEFFEYVMNSMFEERTKTGRFCSSADPFLTLCLNDEEKELDKFRNAYQMQIETNFLCEECKNSFMIHDQAFVIPIPLQSLSFLQNFEAAFEGEVERNCEKCGCKQNFTVKHNLTRAPEYLFIQLLRFTFGKQEQTWEKNQSIIEIPEELNSTKLSYQYDLVGIIYHIGDSSGGHYLTKCLVPGRGIEMFDDARCYFNAALKHVSSQHAYFILYQEHSKFSQERSFVLTEREKEIQNAKEKIEEEKSKMQEIKSNEKKKSPKKMTKVEKEAKKKKKLVCLSSKKK